MPGVTNGAELVKRLRESGTPDGPLAPARACLHEVRAGDRRSATADEVLAAMEAALGPDHGSVRKARCLIATGAVTAAAAPTIPIEDQLLAAEPARPEDEAHAEDGRPEPEPEPEPEGEREPDHVPDGDLDALTVAQLREVASAEGVQAGSKATKADLLAAIRAKRAAEFGAQTGPHE